MKIKFDTTQGFEIAFDSDSETLNGILDFMRENRITPITFKFGPYEVEGEAAMIGYEAHSVDPRNYGGMSLPKMKFQPIGNKNAQ